MNSGMNTQDFYYLLFDALQQNCQYASGHMLRSMRLEDFGDRWVITITAVNDKGYDYARAVNYALAARYRMEQAGADKQESQDRVDTASSMSFQMLRNSRPDPNKKSSAYGISAKEAHNYLWVERTITQVAEAYGGTVKYELH